MTSKRLKIEPLTYESFLPFGTVIQNPSTAGSPIRGVSANQGTARKYGNISPLSNYYHLSKFQTQSKAAMSMFVCSPRRLEKRGSELLLKVKLVERHPFTTQTFVPLGVPYDNEEVQYLVIVAPTLPTTTYETHKSSGGKTIIKNTETKGPGNPDLKNIRAFLARGNQAVTYGAGTWHAPMIVIGNKAIEFVVTQFVNGITQDDCQEMEIPEIEIDVQDRSTILSRL